MVFMNRSKTYLIIVKITNFLDVQIDKIVENMYNNILKTKITKTNIWVAVLFAFSWCILCVLLNEPRRPRAASAVLVCIQTQGRI